MGHMKTSDDHAILPERKIGVTAIVTTIRSGPELRPQANKDKCSKPKTSSKKSQNKKYCGSYLIVDQMEIYCFIKKEQQKASPIW